MITAGTGLLALNQVLVTFRSRSIEARHADTRAGHPLSVDLKHILHLAGLKCQSL